MCHILGVAVNVQFTNLGPVQGRALTQIDQHTVIAPVSDHSQIQYLNQQLLGTRYNCRYIVGTIVIIVSSLRGAGVCAQAQLFIYLTHALYIAVCSFAGARMNFLQPRARAGETQPEPSRQRSMACPAHSGRLRDHACHCYACSMSLRQPLPTAMLLSPQKRPGAWAHAHLRCRSFSVVCAGHAAGVCVTVPDQELRASEWNRNH